MKTTKKNYFKNYYSLFNLYENKNINSNDIMILSILISFSENNKKIYPSDKGISKLINGILKPESINRIITKLHNLNLISKTTFSNENYGGKTRNISINPDVLKLVNGEVNNIQPEVKPIKTEKMITDKHTEIVKKLFLESEAKPEAIAAPVTTPIVQVEEIPSEPIIEASTEVVEALAAPEPQDVTEAESEADKLIKKLKMNFELDAPSEAEPVEEADDISDIIQPLATRTYDTSSSVFGMNPLFDKPQNVNTTPIKDDMITEQPNGDLTMNFEEALTMAFKNKKILKSSVDKVYEFLLENGAENKAMTEEELTTIICDYSNAKQYKELTDNNINTADLIDVKNKIKSKFDYYNLNKQIA